MSWFSNINLFFSNSDLQCYSRDLSLGHKAVTHHTDSLQETAPQGRSHAGVLTLQAIKEQIFRGTIHLCPEEVDIVGYITSSTTRQHQPGNHQKQHPFPSGALFVTFLQHSAQLSAVLLLFKLEKAQKQSSNRSCRSKV